MRRRAPDLVQPAGDHFRFHLRQLGVPSTWDLRQADKDRTSDGQTTANPPALTGSWGGNDAGANLARLLAELGIIDDQTSA